MIFTVLLLGHPLRLVVTNRESLYQELFMVIYLDRGFASPPLPSEMPSLSKS